MRPLEYEFAHAGLADVTDSFMLGPDLLVAPVVERGATSRRVTLPPGTWESHDGARYDGGTVVDVAVDLTTVPRFERV